MLDPAALPTDAPNAADAATVAADAASHTVHGCVGPSPAAAASLQAVAPLAPPAPASRRTIFRNFASVAGIGLISRTVGILLDVYVRRTLGPGVVGMMDWNGAALAYASVVANPGLQTVARRDAAQSPSRAAELFLNTLLLQVGPLLIVAALCVACLMLELRTGLAGHLLVVQAAAGVFAAVQIRWAFEAMDRYVAVNLLGLAMLVLTTLGNVVLVHSPEHALRTVSLQLLGGVALSASTIFLAFRQRIISWRGLVEARRRACSDVWTRYREAFPLTLAGLSVTLYTTGVTLVLGPTHGDTAVGLYTTAYGLMTLGVVAASTLTSVYFPSLARAWVAKDGRAAARAVSFDYFRAVTLVTAPVGLLGWAVGRHVIEAVYGLAYAEVGPYFEWLCLYLVFAGLNMALCGPLISWGQNGIYLRITILGATVNIFLNLALVPRFGVAGAVATAVVTEGLVSLASITVRRRLIPIPYGRTLWSMVAIAAIAIGSRTLSSRLPAMWPAILLLAIAGIVGVIAAFNLSVLHRVLRK